MHTKRAQKGSASQTLSAVFFTFYRSLLMGAVFFFGSLVSGAAEDTAPATWVLAAQKFTFTQKNAQSISGEHFASVLPQLMLEQIAIDGSRVLPSQEVLDRKLHELQTERLSLFLQLSKEYQARDALVLTHAKPRKLEKALQSAQKKIDALQKQIDENLQAVEDVKATFQPKIAREAAIARGETVEDTGRDRWRFPFPFFFGDETDTTPRQEQVTVYKQDSTALFVPTDAALTEGVTSRTYEKEVTGANINGVLSGTITGYGDYLAVTTDLYVYPGAKLVGTVTDVGTIGDQMDLAERIVQQLVPAIANSLPVNLRFEVFPEDAARFATLTVDGLVYNKIPSDLQVDASVHTISVESEGYETASFTYKYEGNERYRVRISLTPKITGTLQLRLKKFSDGIFYAKGLEEQTVSPQQPAAAITVNGKAVLGLFSTGTDEDKKSAFFYIPENRAQDGTTLKVNAKAFDRAENIDKRRRSMYTAYSALICSLPFTFYCTGNFTAANNAYVLGRGSYDDAKTWQTRGYIASGISLACGVWAAIELVRYLWAANQVLPATASVDRRDFSAGEMPPESDTLAATTEENDTNDTAEQVIAAEHADTADIPEE